MWNNHYGQVWAGDLLMVSAMVSGDLWTSSVIYQTDLIIINRPIALGWCTMFCLHPALEEMPSANISASLSNSHEGKVQGGRAVATTLLTRPPLTGGETFLPFCYYYYSRACFLQLLCLFVCFKLSHRQ